MTNFHSQMRFIYIIFVVGFIGLWLFVRFMLNGLAMNNVFLRQESHFYRIHQKVLKQDIKLDLSISKAPCPFLNSTFMKDKHDQLFVSCREGNIIFQIRQVPVLEVQTFNQTDYCLKKATESKQCVDNNKVPKTVHFIWFGNRELPFYAFLAIFSANKFVEPCFILIHCDEKPYGKYWKLLLMLVPKLIIVKTAVPQTIFGIQLGPVEHKADVRRLQILAEYGGIYLDTDAVVLRSLDKFLNYSLTMCEEVPGYNLANGIMVSEKNATFLNIWLQKYKSYNKEQWGYHSTILPFKLSKTYPYYVNVVKYVFINPNYNNIKLLFEKNIDWTKVSYVIHLYIRFYKKKYELSSIGQLNITLGSIARFSLYGDTKLCK